MSKQSSNLLTHFSVLTTVVLNIYFFYKYYSETGSKGSRGNTLVWQKQLLLINANQVQQAIVGNQFE